MIDFRVDESACIQCGECAKDCVMGIISMDNGVPEIPAAKESQCIGCQHCMVVCPTGAVSVLGKKPEDSMDIAGNLPTADEVEMLLKSRRSVRRYRQENVDRAVLERLMDVARNAPTGKNAMNLQFTVVDDMATMQSIREATYAGIDGLVKGSGLPAGFEFFGTTAKLWNTRKVDLLFRGAPHLLWVTAPADSAAPEADPMIALSYFEIMAAALGLGTVWCGFAKWVFTQVLPEMKGRLGVPENHTAGYAMMFGYPDVQYYRTVQRGGQKLHTVSF